jgi:lysophospholipid acyltransferase (LPLAT)-like uncharacterized protein
MARETDAMLVPVYAEAPKSWSFSSWDRFFVPKPFSRVCIRFGDMIAHSTTLDEEVFVQQRANLESTMLPGLVS